MSDNRQTPLEKLISDKKRVTEQSKRQEQKLNEDFSYIQENAGSLLLSGLSSLLFPSTRTSKKADKISDKNATPTQAGTQPATFGLSDYFSIAKGLMPIAWDIAQPLVMTWGIKKLRKWFLEFLFKKKK